ncbi:hypothetical protein ASD78_12315 [Lysobacter sp. Root667]|nr:hypothetical protein ASD78_12315 [Lysobacter sp. Root667]
MRNQDGTISTVRSMSANFDGEEVLIPTVSDDGRILSEDEAVDVYRRTGRHLGKFSTPDAATAYAQSLHEQQAKLYAGAGSAPPLPPGFELEQPINDWDGEPVVADFSGIDVRSTMDSTEPLRRDRSGMTMEQRYAAAGIDPNQYSAIDSTSQVDRGRAGFAKAFVDTLRGVRQLTTNSAGSQVAAGAQLLDRAGLPAAAGFARDQILQPIAASGAAQQQGIDEASRIDRPLMQTGAGIGGNIAGQVAQAAIPGAGVGRAFGAGSRLAVLGQAAARGGAFSAAQPVATGESRAGNAAIGAAAGAGGQVVGSSLGRLARGARDAIDPLKRQLAERAQAAGIPLHLSQLLDSIPAKTAASFAKYVPFSGAGKAAKNQQAAFNRAIARTFGMDADSLGDDVIAGAKNRFNDGYGKIFDDVEVVARPDTLRRMAAIEADAAKNLTADEAKIVSNQLDRILDDLGDGAMSGRKYQSLRSTLGGVKPGTDVGRYVAELRRELMGDAAESLSPVKARALAALDQQYNNFKVAEKLLRQVAGAGGDVKPSSVWAAVNQRGPKATKEMRELAQIGQVLLKDPIPDSGTAGRVFTGGLMTGGAVPLGGAPAAIAALPFAAAAGRGLNSPQFANYLLSGAGQPLQGLARLARTAPVLLPAVARGSQVGKQEPPKPPVRKAPPK